jgi:hypothetical protein
MPMRRGLRLLLWVLWWGCLAFSLWFFWMVYVVYTTDT